MIIVRLAGGLGNQLFQYATGRRLALARRVELKLDTSIYRRSRADIPDEYQRSYRLHHFQIEASVASEQERSRWVGNGWRSRARRHVDRRHWRPRRSFLKERRHCFEPYVLRGPRRAYLTGSWQSERYFSDVRPILGRELQVKNEPEGMNRTLGEEIERVEAVAVHVRRTDYLLSKSGRIEPCPVEYYRRAEHEIRARVGSPHYFVFSDEPDWCAEHLSWLSPATFVSHNALDAEYEDLRLMTRCRHHVIANSTFSWWGAWLAKHDEQCVVAPEAWFAKDTPAHDLYAEGWTAV